jgi:protoheme IX farnesyltransferase
MARGEVGIASAAVFAGSIGVLGAVLLYWFVNPLTMWLTLATFVGYALIYTVVLKPATPQNIVIGGASGAMPPVLGWAAVANEVTAQALVLFLIIFVWTPPHFWSLSLYRIEDYRKSGLPMLPVTHGPEFTRLNILLYTLLLAATSLLPYLIGMSGLFYLGCALVLDAVFVAYTWRMWRRYSDGLARKTFGYSIFYLAALFGALLVDHYLG